MSLIVMQALVGYQDKSPRTIQQVTTLLNQDFAAQWPEKANQQVLKIRDWPNVQLPAYRFVRVDALVDIRMGNSTKNTNLWSLSSHDHSHQVVRHGYSETGVHVQDNHSKK